ncbi:hypothetical protein ACA910_009425 [Epithemia clementina (nom. ined.)]
MPDARVALMEQKNAVHIQDTLPVDKMYCVIPATATTCHGLPEHAMQVKLKCFHDHLADFANTGTRPSLCNTINVLDTTRYNVKSRYQLRMASEPERVEVV